MLMIDAIVCRTSLLYCMARHHGWIHTLLEPENERMRTFSLPWSSGNLVGIVV